MYLALTTNQAQFDYVSLQEPLIKLFAYPVVEITSHNISLKLPDAGCLNFTLHSQLNPVLLQNKSNTM